MFQFRVARQSRVTLAFPTPRWPWLTHQCGVIHHRYVSESLFAESFQAVLQSTLESTETLGKQLAGIKLKNEGAFDTTGYGKQLKQVAKVIKLHKTTAKTERAVFYTSQGGFDSHATYDISDKMTAIDDALQALKEELDAINAWDEVTVVVASDFG